MRIYLSLIVILFSAAVGLGQIQTDPIQAPPTVRGSDTIVLSEIKIEIRGITRVKEYQPYFVGSKIPRGRKFTAGEGQEIAVVKIHTTRLGIQRGIRFEGLFILDPEKNAYQGYFESFFLGTNGERSMPDPKELDYEFPVQIPLGTKISAVQLQRRLFADTLPQQGVIEKTILEVSSLNF